jgi:hypothetical protein
LQVSFGPRQRRINGWTSALGVNIDTQDRSVYVCRRIGDLVIDEDSMEGMCDWVDSEDARPGELTDGLAISNDCLAVGPRWWLDTYAPPA